MQSKCATIVQTDMQSAPELWLNPFLRHKAMKLPQSTYQALPTNRGTPDQAARQPVMAKHVGSCGMYIGLNSQRSRARAHADVS